MHCFLVAGGAGGGWRQWVCMRVVYRGLSSDFGMRVCIFDDEGRDCWTRWFRSVCWFYNRVFS